MIDGITRQAAPPETGRPRIYKDAGQEYREYAREARTPSLSEYQQLQRAGAHTSYGQYAHEKQSAPPKSYEQFSYERAMGSSSGQPGGDTLQKALDAAKNVPDIRALGAGGEMSGLQRIADDKEQRLKEMRERYRKNLEIEEAGFGECVDVTGHINGQATGVLATMSFGSTIDETVDAPLIREKLHDFNKSTNFPEFGTAANGACESIAIYNALRDLGKDVSLSQIIYDTERNNYMLWNGWFGTKVSKVDDLLRMYGAESQKVSMEEVQKSVAEGEIKEGQVYIASAWNKPSGLMSGLHTVEIVYLPSQNPLKPWVAYNMFDEKASEEGRYSYIKPCGTFSDIFEGAMIQILRVDMG